MKHVSQIVAAAFFVAAVPAAATEVGVRDIDVTVPERGVTISATLWYPAAGEGEAVKVGDNGIFQGAQALRDAKITPGRKPIVLLSHGGLRSAPGAESWIAAALAGRGFVVAVPHPPKVKAAQAPAEYWLRPADMSATLTALEHNPELGVLADTRNVGALGFFLGGTSALVLAGAELDVRGVQATCDGEMHIPDCDWFRKSGVDLHEMDFTILKRPVRDERVKSVIAVNPELTHAFTTAPSAVPVRVITLGNNGASALPNASHDTVAGAIPFDAFNECKPKALAILRAEGEDESLCAAAALLRGEVHAHLLDMIVKSFTERSLASE